MVHVYHSFSLSYICSFVFLDVFSFPPHLPHIFMPACSLPSLYHLDIDLQGKEEEEGEWDVRRQWESDRIRRSSWRKKRSSGTQRDMQTVGGKERERSVLRSSPSSFGDGWMRDASGKAVIGSTDSNWGKRKREKASWWLSKLVFVMFLLTWQRMWLIRRRSEPVSVLNQETVLRSLYCRDIRLFLSFRFLIPSLLLILSAPSLFLQRQLT